MRSGPVRLLSDRARRVNATAWPTDDAAYGLTSSPAPAYRFDVTDAVKAQVREICTGIKQANKSLSTRALRVDLRKYAAEVLLKPPLTRDLRHFLTDPAERDLKLIDETGFNMLGEMVEPPHQQWERPEAMTLYHRLMLRDSGAVTINDLGAADLQHVTWMIGRTLVEIDDAGRILLLSDEVLPDETRYQGAPAKGKIMINGRLVERASIGQTHTSEEVQKFVLQVWQMIVDGHPPMDIGGEYRQEMTTGRGLRMSGRMMTYQCNKLHAAWMDANCNCLGRDQVAHAWELADHGEGCAGRKRWFSVDVIRRAIRELMESGALTRTDEAYRTRRNHTAHRVPAAYEIPADAGWHAYVTRRRTKHPRRPSALEKRLLGDLAAYERKSDPYPSEFQDETH